MQCFSASDIGLTRNDNQDFFGIREYDSGVVLAVLCDGMGGHNGGSNASHIAVEEFMNSMDSFIESCTQDNIFTSNDFDISYALREAVDVANTKIMDTAADNEELNGMGTTLVAVLISGSMIYVVNVGDSRMYHITPNRIDQITHDHTYVQYLIDLGKMTKEESQVSPNRHILTKALGMTGDLEADVFIINLDDIIIPAEFRYILLCSDGLYNMIDKTDIKEIISDDEIASENKVNALIDKANENGGTDNITTVLISM